MPIIPLRLGDRVKLKKDHPCGGKIFQILRVGSVVRIVCETCGRDMTIDRIKLEKAIKQIITESSDQTQSKGTL